MKHNTTSTSPVLTWQFSSLIPAASDEMSVDRVIFTSHRNVTASNKKKKARRSISLDGETLYLMMKALLGRSHYSCTVVCWKVESCAQQFEGKTWEMPL